MLKECQTRLKNIQDSWHQSDISEQFRYMVLNTYQSANIFYF